MIYKTKHRKELELFLKNNSDIHLTINEISINLPNIPLATLYRLIDGLLEEGLVRKYIIGPNSSCCFQYIGDNNCHEHFHLICEKCGKLIHLECHEVDHLLDHIQDDHSFKVDVSKINLYGVCKDCQKGEGK